MGKIIPNLRPQAARDTIDYMLAERDIRTPVVLIGVRGYFLDSMGKPGKNDRGIYDDAIFIVTPNVFAAFNANCDPSIFKTGIATLQDGLYTAVKWRHRGRYPALQIVEDKILRDGSSKVQVGRVGINIHYGGENSTWSEGCQTLPKSQWNGFINLVYSEMTRLGLREIPYLLTKI